MKILIVILLLVLIATDGFLIYETIVKREEVGKTPKPKLTKEQKDKQKQIKESFENLMNYDETTARRRK